MQTELQRFEGLEAQLRDLSITVLEADSVKKFTPRPGSLLQFINLLGKSGVVYEVTRASAAQL